MRKGTVYLQRWVDKANNIGIECPIDREQDGQLSEGLHGAEKHRTNDYVTEDLEIGKRN
jgi:folate-dependent tRNA-U54 methylase TrmFO/GidA